MGNSITTGKYSNTTTTLWVQQEQKESEWESLWSCGSYRITMRETLRRVPRLWQRTPATTTARERDHATRQIRGREERERVASNDKEWTDSGVNFLIKDTDSMGEHAWDDWNTGKFVYMCLCCVWYKNCTALNKPIGLLVVFGVGEQHEHWRVDRLFL